jgi:hypothetical protein
LSNKKNYNGTVEELEFHRGNELNDDYADVNSLEVNGWELETQNSEFYHQDLGNTGVSFHTGALEKYTGNNFGDNFGDNFGNKWESNQQVRLELEEDWEEDAWMERWRVKPDKYIVTPLPPELAQRLEDVLKETKMKRSEFVLKALEEACLKAELDKIRRRGLAEGEPAKLIKDPQTGKFRCFPADFFTEEDLYGLEVIDGKYYQKRWEKTEKGWVEVNKGYFEATGDQDAPYIKMVNNKPVGSWEVYPFDFFEDGWKWGIYDNEDVVIEVIGRKDKDGQLWLDVYVDTKLVDSVRTARDVHRIIMQYQ